MHEKYGKKRAGPWSTLQRWGGGGLEKGLQGPPPPQSKFFGSHVLYWTHSSPPVLGFAASRFRSCSKYRPVAFNGSTLFFCVASLSMVDPMYQYSLQWFNNLFLAGIDNAEPSEDLDERSLPCDASVLFWLCVLSTSAPKPHGLRNPIPAASGTGPLHGPLMPGTI